MLKQGTGSTPTLIDLLLERAHEGLCLVAPDGTVLHANAEWLRSTGLSESDVLGADIVDLFPATRDLSLALHSRARAGHHVEVSRHVQVIDGRETWWEGCIDPVPMEGGTGLLIAAREVTTEEALSASVEAERRSSVLLRAIADSIPDPVYAKDAQGRVLFANRAVLQVTGKTALQVIGRTDREIYDDQAVGAKIVENDRHILESGEAVAVEERIETPAGYRFFLSTKAPFRDEAGNVLGLVGVSRDVTESKRAEEALRDSELLYRSLFTLAPSSVVLLDESGKFIAFNDGAHERLGYTREEFAKLQISDIDADESPEDVRRHILRIFEAGVSEFDARHRAKSGELRYMRARSRLVKMHDKRLLLSVWLDVTEQRRTERALRESEARLRALGDNLPHGAVYRYQHDADGHPRFLYVSRGIEALTGVPPVEALGDPTVIHDLLHPEDRSRLMVEEARSRDALSTFEMEIRQRHRTTGEERWSLLRSVPSRLQDGSTVWDGIQIDITDRKRAEEALRASEEWLRALADSMPQLAWTARPDGYITWFNRRCYEYTGATPDQLEGWAWQRVHDPATLPHVLRSWTDAIEKGHAFEMEFPLRGADGKFRSFLSRASPLKDDAGKVLQWFGTHTDVTELVAAQETLREADRRKDEFLGMLSHELRNPLAPIRNALYILDHAEPGGQQARRAKEVARRQLVHITRIVDDLLDVTRIARGKIELRRAEVDLAALTRRTAEDHRPLMQDRGLELRLILPPGPVVVNGDETRLAQVLGNLLHNASKFTPAGGQVTLTVGHQGGRALVHVRDTGVGMEPETLRTIFEPFVQGKQTLARSEGGLGLGLALVKGLVTLHGGDITARSAGAGRGTEFVLTIPLDRRRSVRTRPGHGGELGPPQRRQVLVVDDNPDAAETLAELLRMVGHEVVVAHDGPKALALAKADPPDVVLCDIGLPGMDGYELARQLRAGGVRGIRLIAVSGYAQPEDVARATEAGFDAHVAKPPDPEELARIVAG